MKKNLLLSAILCTGCASNSNFAPVIDFSISAATGISVSHIRHVNKAYNQIKVTNGDYTVKWGDTLSEIAFNSGLSMHLIAEKNGLNAPYTLQAGQKLAIKSLISSRIKSSKGTSSINKDPIDQTENVSRVAYGYPGDKILLSDKERSELSRSVPTHNGWVRPAPDGALNKSFKKMEGKGVEIVTGDQYIHTAKAGTIAFTDGLRGYGSVIIVEHDKKIMSVYSGEFDYNVKKGDKVKAGDVIGQYKNVGMNTLNFQIRQSGKAFDPTKFAI